MGRDRSSALWAAAAAALILAGCRSSSSETAVEIVPGGEPGGSCAAPGAVTTELPPTTVPLTTTSPTIAEVVETTAAAVPTIAEVVPTTAAVPTTERHRDLDLTARGADVTAVQHRLVELGYWLPAISGEYDAATQHAIVAFEKTHGLERDGILTADDRSLLDSAEPIVGRSVEGHVIEVDIVRQVVLVVDDGTVTWVMDTSTGARPGWTPTGSYNVEREIDGLRVSELGQLYRPKYVVGGVALHGYPDVPPEPASHGCIRLTNGAMDAIWSMGLAPIGTPVLIYDD